ncbi:regulatory protein uhpC [Planoprotostelium fungivorum]|uniref:Regulatory protein uhpC n=1 Tax=Planoprotostelium fungivorum TaxID=1890364 RepID=A0A2P6NK87_9EUKA|nr:regulatory protein uhpC [Planoprotostelium fungivorum]
MTNGPTKSQQPSSNTTHPRGSNKGMTLDVAGTATNNSTQLVYRQSLIVLGAFASTFFINVGRRNLNSCLSDLLQDQQLPKTQYGVLSSCQSAAYSFSKLFGGMAADYYFGPRAMLVVALTLSGSAAICFGLSSQVFLFTFFWTMNGLAQGISWIPIAKMLTRWFLESERATKWAIASSAQQLGGAFIAISGSWITGNFGWRSTMMMSGAAIAMAALVPHRLMSESPESEGLSLVKTESATPSPREQDEGDKGGRVNAIDLVYRQPISWFLAFATFSLYVVRTAVLDWVILLLMESRGLTQAQAASCIFWFEIFGFLGGFAASISSDKIWLGNRIPVIVYMSWGLVLSTYVLWKFPSDRFFDNWLVVSIIGFFIYGPQTLLTVAATELVDRRATGTILGLVGAFSGLGSVFAGMPLGFFREKYGWDAYCAMVVFFSLLLTLSLTCINLGYVSDKPTKIVPDKEQMRDGFSSPDVVTLYERLQRLHRISALISETNKKRTLRQSKSDSELMPPPSLPREKKRKSDP